MLEDVKECLKGINCNDDSNCLDCPFSNMTANYCKSEINQAIRTIEKVVNNMPRKLVIPGIYKHFKHAEDGIPNNYIYAVVGISEPLHEKWLNANINLFEYNNNEEIFKNISHFYTNYTEDSNITLMCFGFDEGHNFYHSKEILDKKVVIYVSLYNGKQYARPYDMFMSEVPEGKENPSGQKYRFELVRY